MSLLCLVGLNVGLCEVFQRISSNLIDDTLLKSLTSIFCLSKKHKVEIFQMVSQFLKKSTGILIFLALLQNTENVKGNVFCFVLFFLVCEKSCNYEEGLFFPGKHQLPLNKKQTPLQFPHSIGQHT